MKKKIALISHGCAKNLVDSELMLGILDDAGYSVTLDESESDIVIVNTCSFIHDAEKESVQSIFEMLSKGKKVVVTGCLPQKYQHELESLLPEAAAFVGTSDLSKIAGVIAALEEKKTVYCVSKKPEYIYPEQVVRRQITLGASSFLKIAEGCSYKCGYCVIPRLRGSYKSRPMENILQEAKELVSKGVNEIVLIAQDTTAYGKDIYGRYALAELLEKLNKIEDLQWIRVMYTYPSTFSDELIDAFSSLEKVVKYIDIPLQHSHPDMLKAMYRPVLDYEELIEKMRRKIDDVAIRSTFIVGYPSESEEQFEHLYNFVEKMRFDKVGVFEYCREKGTPSYSMKPQVLSKVKKERRKKIMQMQQVISKEINESFIGKILPCIVETVDARGHVVARSYRDAPEVDGYVYVKTDKPLIPGDIESVKIVSASEYDLFGETV